MLRRAASGHIEATQLPKFAAASRIALAVIKGWPEAPSSPLQGWGPPLPPPVAAVAGPEAPDFGPEKILLKKFETPLPSDDCASAWPQTNSIAAITIAPVRSCANNPVRCVMSYPYCRKAPLSGGLFTVSNSLTRLRFCGQD